MMDVICLGEIIIDFFAVQSGAKIQDVDEFKRIAGGATANVAVGCSRLGKKAAFIGRVGNDDFGFHLRDILLENNVNAGLLQFDNAAGTGLAFVALPTPTTRDFLFYLNSSATMQLNWQQFDTVFIKNTGIFHFGSITLIDEPARTSTIKAAEIAKDGGAIISYDPNLRINLWKDGETAKKQIVSAIPLADIIKVNDDELMFITGEKDMAKGAEELLGMGPKLCLITMGSKGSFYATSSYKGMVPIFDVATVDTTGCGDSFMSAFLSFISGKDFEKVISNENEIKTIAVKAAAASSITSMKKGVIPSLPYLQQLESFMKDWNL